MGIKDIPKGMTAAQVNVLVGVRDKRVYRRKSDGLEKDFMDNDVTIPVGVGRQVTWLLDKGYIHRSAKDARNRSYYVLTDQGMIIAQGL